jgi:hypothetical protein
MPQNDKGLLLRLQQQDLEFVIIGGVCGVLHGVSLVTLDLDICCEFSVDNLRRIERAVSDLNPRHRLTANKLPLELTDELCGRLKNLYLQTNLGVLDCLSEVQGVGDFAQCLEQSEPKQLSYGRFRILKLSALIAAKEAAGREKDIAALRQLRAIQERLQEG